MSVSDHPQRMFTGLATIGLSALLAVASGSAFSQQAGREQEQLRRLRQQVQQLQQDQTAQQDALQRATNEKAAAGAELDTVRTELRRARSATAIQTRDHQAAHKELDSARQEQAALQTVLDGSQAALQVSVQSADALRAANAELKRGLAVREVAFNSLSSRHGAQAQGLQTCIVSNQTLRDIGQDLLQMYANKSVADVMVQNEPFLQVKRVAMENLLQGYQDKLDEKALRVTPGALVPLAGAPVPGEPYRAP